MDVGRVPARIRMVWHVRLRREGEDNVALSRIRVSAKSRSTEQPFPTSPSSCLVLIFYPPHHYQAKQLYFIYILLPFLDLLSVRQLN